MLTKRKKENEKKCRGRESGIDKPSDRKKKKERMMKRRLMAKDGEDGSGAEEVEANRPFHRHVHITGSLDKRQTCLPVNRGETR